MAGIAGLFEGRGLIETKRKLKERSGVCSRRSFCEQLEETWLLASLDIVHVWYKIQIMLTALGRGWMNGSALKRSILKNLVNI